MTKSPDQLGFIHSGIESSWIFLFFSILLPLLSPPSCTAPCRNFCLEMSKLPASAGTAACFTTVWGGRRGVLVTTLSFHILLTHRSNACLTASTWAGKPSLLYALSLRSCTQHWLSEHYCNVTYKTSDRPVHIGPVQCHSAVALPQIVTANNGLVSTLNM